LISISPGLCFNKLKKVLGEDLTNQLKKVFSEETPVAPAIEFVETSLLDGSGIVKGTIAVGETVTLVLPDGSEVPAPDGQHTLEGDIVIPPNSLWVPLWAAAGTSMLGGYSVTWKEIDI
jgi:hypothetical protein